MKFAAIFGRESYKDNGDVLACISALTNAGNEVVSICADEVVPGDVDVILSIGGDGTFLLSASKAGEIPVMGINFGRMGFLSENTPQTALRALLSGDYIVEKRVRLDSVIYSGDDKSVPASRHTALNEVVVSRSAAAMLGVNVTIDGKKLPTYWADGLLISTPSGSTAYSLSIGGPIVLPSSKVLIIAPVAPHNLNVRPLVVPVESRISLDFISRDDVVKYSSDNDSILINSNARVDVQMARFSLNRLRLRDADFLQALSDKLHWGEDIRNR